MQEKLTECVVGRIKPKFTELQAQVKVDVQDEIVRVYIPTLIQEQVQNEMMKMQTLPNTVRFLPYPGFLPLYGHRFVPL